MNYSVIDLLKNDAKRYPNKIAFADVENQITYNQLNTKAQSFASGLLAVTKPQQPIVFFMDKSVDLIIGFMGTVYAGCCYSVIDVKQPLSRLTKILDVLNPALIITTETNKKSLDTLASIYKVVVFESIFSNINATELAKIDDNRLDIDPLIVLF